MSAARRDRRHYCPPLTTWERRVERKMAYWRERLWTQGIFIATKITAYMTEDDVARLGDLGCRRTESSW